MIGHEIRLTETNRGGFVPICECGWVGAVTPMQHQIDPKTQRARRQRELTMSIAESQHKRHLHDVRADIAAQSDAALDSHARLIATANKTLQRRGRWGNG